MKTENTAKACISADRGGFTLIEVMIALTVFAVGISAVLAVLIQVERGSRLSDEATQACFLAHRKMEELMSLPSGSPVLMATCSPEGSAEEDPHGETNGRFAMEWDVRDIPPVAKSISLTVRWNTGFGAAERTHQYRLTSMTSGDSP